MCFVHSSDKHYFAQVAVEDKPLGFGQQERVNCELVRDVFAIVKDFN